MFDLDLTFKPCPDCGKEWQQHWMFGRLTQGNTIPRKLVDSESGIEEGKLYCASPFTLPEGLNENAWWHHDE